MATRPYELGWALDWLDVQTLWRDGLRGQGIRVGHLDTPLIADHPALHGRLREVRSFGHTDPVADSGRVHGTATASLVCGQAVAGFDVGVAPDAQVLSAAVLHATDVVRAVLLGFEWVASCGVRVICVPFGFPESPILAHAVRKMRRRDILVVAASGNGGGATVLAPAKHSAVIAVGAVDARGEVARFSGHLGDKPEIYAPGADVLAAVAGDHLDLVSGTSMATAFVAGVCALIAGACPTANTDDLAAALVESSDDRRIAPEAAVALLRNGARGVASPPTDCDRPTRHRDPALIERLGAASKRTLISAAVAPAVDLACHGHPHHVENLETLDTMIVTASPRYLSDLADDDAVQIMAGTTVTTHWAD